MRRIDGMDICLNLFHKTKVSHAVSPLKLFEYLAHRKPVISTRLDEVNRINEGFLFFADTADEVAQAITAICEHPEKAHAMALKGYEVVKAKFAWPVIAREFVQAVSLAETKC